MAALRGSSVTWVDMAAPPSGWEIVLRKSRFSVGQNHCPIFRRLWIKVHQINIEDAGEIVVCNEVYRLSISRSVPEIFAIDVQRRPKSRRKKTRFRPQIFLGKDPQILDLVFKIASTSDHAAKFRGDRRRDRGDLVANKKKKQQQNIRAVLRYLATGGHNYYISHSQFLVFSKISKDNVALLYRTCDQRGQ